MEEQPKYANINEEELKQMEAEFGGPLSEELAQWFIRNRIQREAIERMLGEKHEDYDERVHGHVRKVVKRRKVCDNSGVARKKCA